MSGPPRPKTDSGAEELGAPPGRSQLKASGPSTRSSTATPPADHLVAAGSRAQWITSPSCRPTDLDARLEAAGWEPEVEPTMAVSIDAAFPPPPEEIAVEPVRSVAEFREWTDTFDLAFEIDPRGANHPGCDHGRTSPWASGPPVDCSLAEWAAGPCPALSRSSTETPSACTAMHPAQPPWQRLRIGVDRGRRAVGCQQGRLGRAIARQPSRPPRLPLARVQPGLRHDGLELASPLPPSSGDHCASAGTRTWQSRRSRPAWTSVPWTMCTRGRSRAPQRPPRTQRVRSACTLTPPKCLARSSGSASSTRRGVGRVEVTGDVLVSCATRAVLQRRLPS